MSDTPTETPKPIEPQVTNIDVSPSFTEQVKMKMSEIFSSWKLKAGLIILGVISVFIFMFFWPHLVATQGLKGWSTSSGAQSISCMIKDTNDDGYVSCSALLENEVVPLECGSSLFNLGCRINYGAAAPSIKVKARNNR
ncbi:MAG: hypothetical protein WBA13_15680 [Microcoleaceae cyanobacterium]